MARPSKLGAVDTDALMKEIERRQKRLPQLQRKRRAVVKQLETIDRQIAALGGDTGATTSGRGRRKNAAVSKPRRRRPRNKSSLVEVLASAVGTSKPMGLPEIAAAVKKRGYKSSSDQFNNIIAQALVKDKRFKRAGRGKYVRVG